MAISIERIDHFVITVSDLNTTLQFYERVLGMESATFGDGRLALHFGNQKINIHPFGNEANPPHPTHNLEQPTFALFQRFQLKQSKTI